MPSHHRGDLDLHPIARGFWTDDEMFEATGATSIALIKQMQKDKLIEPGRYKTAAGKWARAWSGSDLLRIALVVDVAFHTGFNLSVSSLILGAIGTEKIDQVLAAHDTLRIIQDTYGSMTSASRMDARGLPEGWTEKQIEIIRPNELELEIVNREFVFTAVLANSRDRKRDDYNRNALGSIDQAKTNSPKLWLSDVDSSPEVETSSLTVALHRLATRPVEYAFGLDAYVDMWDG